MTKQTVGEALVAELRQRGVSCVFGIPGVHTVELYRGLAASGIRHVTPRHEQGADATKHTADATGPTMIEVIAPKFEPLKG